LVRFAQEKVRERGEIGRERAENKRELKRERERERERERGRGREGGREKERERKDRGERGNCVPILCLYLSACVCVYAFICTICCLC
jgi:hypothetical protein